MVARLAKELNRERAPATPVIAIEDGLVETAVVGPPTALLASCEVSHPQDQGSGGPVGNELDHLFAALDAVTPQSHPRTARLLAASNRKVAQKVIEEAGEVALAAVQHNSRGIVRESADLLYHLVVLWRRVGLDPADIWAEMRRRADSLGIAEKLPKSGPL